MSDMWQPMANGAVFKRVFENTAFSAKKYDCVTR